MSPRRRRVLARAAGVVGVLTQLLIALTAIVISPAAMVGAITGIAGVRQVGRDPEASAMRIGTALLASGVGLLFGFVGGAVMAATALTSTAAFSVALVAVRHLEREARAAFGIRHRDWERRNLELQKRREELANNPPPEEATRAPRDADRPAQGAWWEELE